jgi:hypothetical protein
MLAVLPFQMFKPENSQQLLSHQMTKLFFNQNGNFSEATKKRWFKKTILLHAIENHCSMMNTHLDQRIQVQFVPTSDMFQNIKQVLNDFEIIDPTKEEIYNTYLIIGGTTHLHVDDNYHTFHGKQTDMT